MAASAAAVCDTSDGSECRYNSSDGTEAMYMNPAPSQAISLYSLRNCRFPCKRSTVEPVVRPRCDATLPSPVDSPGTNHFLTPLFSSSYTTSSPSCFLPAPLVTTNLIASLNLLLHLSLITALLWTLALPTMMVSSIVYGLRSRDNPRSRERTSAGVRSGWRS